MAIMEDFERIICIQYEISSTWPTPITDLKPIKHKYLQLQPVSQKQLIPKSVFHRLLK